METAEEKEREIMVLTEKTNGRVAPLMVTSRIPWRRGALLPLVWPSLGIEREGERERERA